MIYLDNAATTLQKPPEVAQAVMDAMLRAGNPGRGVHSAALEASRIVYEARSVLAQLFGADNPSTIAFTMNATESLNIAIRGILQPGDHVITTAAEHNSVLRPLYAMEQQGVSLTILPCDSLGRVSPAAFEAALRPSTKAIVCTHGSNLTGNLLDIAAIGQIARRNGLIFLVDAAQTAGAIPMDVQALGIDILCFTGHKGLLGPQGTGGLYVRPGLEVRPLLCGGSGVQSYSKTHPTEMPTALEAGTLNTHGLAGLAAGVRYLLEKGVDTLGQQEQALARQFREGVQQIPGVTVYGDPSPGQRCPIVSLNLGQYDSALVSDALATRYGIATRAGAHCAPLMHQALGTVRQGAVRFSFSHFNTPEETAQAIRALQELAQP